ncbi:MAG TPA: thioredoxin domain-containing protein [Planctomycetota bacterium]
MFSPVLALVVSAFPSLAPSFEEPFADLAYEAALAQARTEKKVLLVDFMATWCGPCKKMEKDTWAAEDVRAWLRENALAIQVDVDEQGELARRFQVEAMPTVVALRDGAEFDRIVGYKDAAAFLAWGRDVRAGKRASDALLQRSKELRASEDVRARRDLARELQHARLLDEALVHYLWLWPASREYAPFSGVRLSFMLSEMADLARQHEPARKAFDEIFAGLQARVDAAEVPSFQDWQEWTAFCKYFGQDERVVAWYEQRRDAEGRLLAGRADHLAGLIVSEVFDVLIEADRSLDAVRLFPDARVKAAEIVRGYERARPGDGIAEEHRESLQRYQDAQLVSDLARLHAALLLAQRTAEAVDVSATLLDTLDTPEAREGLVRHGLDLVPQPLPIFARWLDEAEAAGANVRSLRRRMEKLSETPAGK